MSYSNELLEALSEKSKSGNTEAKYHLGMLYNNGVGVEKSPKKAFELFLAASNEGDALAHYKVGCYYAGQFGTFEGLKLDKDKAFSHKLIAAEAGYSLAQNDVAGAYFREGDIENALIWIKEAGEQGYLQALSSLLALYKMPDSKIENDALAYQTFLKINKLIPRNQKAEEMKNELESELDPTVITRIKNEIETWQPQAAPQTQKANQGIGRAREVAGITSKLK